MHGTARQTVGVKRLGVVFLLMALGAVLAPPAEAAVWRVNAASTAATPDGQTWATAFPAIQPAVNAAASGDEVWVAAGTYTSTGLVVVNLKAGITLYGGFAGMETARDQRVWQTNVTVIDGEQKRCCVTAADMTSTVGGFTLQNGQAYYGGGMYNGTATNCTFTGSTAEAAGGGMYNGMATNCTFTGNTAKNVGGGMCFGTATNCTFTENAVNGLHGGGGMYEGTAISCAFTSNAARHGHGGGMAGGTATDCTFTGNSSDSYGGGMCDGTATNCTLRGNSAVSEGGGGMANVTATNCIFNANTSGGSGGGMLGGTAVNCTFIGNSTAADAYGGGMAGGTAINGIFTKNSAYQGGGMGDGTANNCTFTGNSAVIGGGTLAGTATNCVIWGNAPQEVQYTTVSFSCLSVSTAGTGNIVGSPEFVNPWAGDFRLRLSSPCVDAASSGGAPSTDLLGRARPQGAGVDMGAYEHQAGDDAGAVDVSPILRVNAASTATNPDGLSWEKAYPTLQAAADRSGYGGEIWVAEGTYSISTGNEVVKLLPATSLFGGFAGTETVREHRDVAAHPTVIDGQGARRCVTANAAASVDGFTLRNGMADRGGGMSSGTATNCTLISNSAGLGGGTYYATAQNCYFTGNSARTPEGGGSTYSGDGGGMHFGTAVNCIFTGNSATSYGGGTFWVVARNCTLSGNSASSGAGMAFGTAVNCIIWGNAPEERIATNISYSCLSVATGGAGNIVGDPLFVNAAAGDLRLQPGSPCIGAGAAEDAPSVDILGVPRPQGTGIDMGAHEMPAPVSVPELTGLARSAAHELIVAAQLYVRNETEKYHPTVAPGHVVSQEPAAGTKTVTNTPVDLIISKGPAVLVPNVVDQAQAAARAAIAGAGLTVGMVSEAYSATVPAGNVLSQNPAAGTEVLPGTPVDFVISKGPQPVPVPGVVGQAQAAATAAIAGAGLTVGMVSQAYSATVPAGNVLSQNPTAGTEVLPGTPVDLVISKGPQPVPVPDVVGQAQAAAGVAITGAGLTVGTVSQAYSATVPMGNVVAQNPAAGTEVLPGTPVDLLVSKGVQPSVMPDLSGMTRVQAVAAIIGGGLVLGTVTENHSDTVAAGTVMAQSPAAGTEVPPGTVVSFVVSLGSAPVPEGEGEAVDADTAREALAQAFDMADTDNDGTLSFDEAATAIPGLPRATFDALDTDGDGRLTPDELGLDDGSGCAGCQGGKSAFQPKRLADLFLMALGALGLAAMSTLRRR